MLAFKAQAGLIYLEWPQFYVDFQHTLPIVGNSKITSREADNFAYVGWLGCQPGLKPWNMLPVDMFLQSVFTSV